MNVLTILKKIFLYIKNLFYLKILALNARHTDVQFYIVFELNIFLNKCAVGVTKTLQILP